MNHQNQLRFGIKLKQLTLPALLGTLAPLALLLFLIIADKESFQLWMFIPLILIPLGGAVGGIFLYLMGFVWFPFGKQKLIAVIISTIFYFVVLWMAAVLAFSFTGRFD